MKEKTKSAKDKIKDKLAKTKDKVKAKVKGKLKGALAALAVLLFAAGCSTATPASRYTATTVGDIVVKNNVDDLRSRSGRAATNAVEAAAAKAPLVSIATTIKLSDMTLASADSEGSTETQTATPTTTIDVKPDIRYNDAIAGATSASKGVLSAIGYGADAVLEMMASKKTGTVKVQKKDGTDAVVKCENGQCSFCEDGACGPSEVAK